MELLAFSNIGVYTTLDRPIAHERTKVRRRTPTGRRDIVLNTFTVIAEWYRTINVY